MGKIPADAHTYKGQKQGFTPIARADENGAEESGPARMLPAEARMMAVKSEEKDVLQAILC